MRYLALLGTLLLASGCWGGEFSPASEKAEPVTTTDAPEVTSTTGEPTSNSSSGSGGSDATTTTTGSSGSGAEGGADSTTSTTGEPQACAPPTEIPELSELVLGEYEDEPPRMCGGSGAGRVTCAEEPCLVVDLDVKLISVSEDGLMFDVIVAPQEPQIVPMVHHCEREFGEATCDWPMKVSGDSSTLSESSYTLELIETPTGYAVGDFYVKDYPHLTVLYSPPIVPVAPNFQGQDPNCQQSIWSFNYLLQEAWQQHLDKIHSLAWECAS